LVGVATWFAAMRISGHPLAGEIVGLLRNLSLRVNARRTANRIR
jgi:hypothetical protein